ncbi:hypothetical protein ILUMI_05914 [Ignelater luminosus]|uniref:DDE Tnp4 domain-containing protein n=1 Tax=Ignelater luminosus TaxID=2038154 RepID=A0A8K0DB19_IGNLU|nr:hypothetical protein ILUMI_05914 [Ignelater luminosus]
MSTHKNLVEKAVASVLTFWLSGVESDEEDENCIFINQQATVVERYSLDDFLHLFQLGKITFEAVLNNLDGKLCRPANDAKHQLLVGLWMLANQESYRTVTDRFDISISMAWDYFKRIVDALVSIVQDVVQWPRHEEYRQDIATEFHKKQGFPRVIGAIDGTHIPIATPHDMQNP